MARRIHDIARDFGISNKAIVDRCRAEGVSAVRNHMSTVTAQLEALIRT